jgi:hypothetical protein
MLSNHGVRCYCYYPRVLLRPGCNISNGQLARCPAWQTVVLATEGTKKRLRKGVFGMARSGNLTLGLTLE